MGFFAAVESGYRNYFTFTGRATRAEYWWFTLWNMLLVIGMVTFVAGGAVLHHQGNASGLLLILLGGVMALLVLATAIPSIALQVRRLHDAGTTGYWVLAQLAVSFLRSFVHVVDHANPNHSLHMVGLLLTVMSLGIGLIVFVYLVQPSKPNYRNDPFARY